MSFKDLLGDIGAGAFGLTGPTQAKNMGLPQAAGMTPDELKQLMAMPERQARMEASQELAANRKNMLARDHTMASDQMLQNFPNIGKMGFRTGDYVPNRFLLQEIAPPSRSKTLTPDRTSKQWGALVDKVAMSNGKWLIDDIFRGIGQTEGRRAFIEDLQTKYPNYNPSAAIANRKQLLAEASVRGNFGYKIATASKAVDLNMQKLESLIASTPSASLRIATAALRKGLRQTNDTAATKVLGLLMTTAYEEARVENGGYAPSDDAQRDMRELFAEGLDSNGFRGVQEAVEITNTNRVLSYDSPWEVGEKKIKQPAPKNKTDDIDSLLQEFKRK